MYKIFIFAPHIKILYLSLNELKQLAKRRCIIGYKSMSKLLSVLESAGSRNNFNNARIKKIRENFDKLRDRFLKPKIKRN